MELIIAMTLTTVVVASVLSLLISQSRFVDNLSAGVEQLEQVRASSDLMGAEIADIVRGSITYAASDSIAMRLPVAWGEVCGDITPAPTTKKVKVAVPSVLTDAIFIEPLPTALGTPEPDGFAVTGDGVTWQFFDVADWSALGIVQDVEARNLCLGLAVGTALPTGDENASLFHRFPTLKDYVTIRPEGMVLHAYVYLSYSFAPAEGGGLVLYRGGNDGAQKVAWPFDAATAGFRYRLESDPSTSLGRTSVAEAQLGEIRFVKVFLPAERRTTSGNLAPPTLETHPWLPMYNAR